MGWGVNDYPQPRDEAEAYHCENYKCGRELDEDEIAPECQHPKCSNTILCADCSYECADCKKTVCIAHVCETPMASENESMFRCCDCQGKVDHAECLATRKPPVRELEAMSPAGWALAR